MAKTARAHGPPSGDPVHSQASEDVAPLTWLRSRNTFPFNLTGFPAISLPCGFTQDGMPIGLQVVGRAFDEVTLLRIANAYEQATRCTRCVPRQISERGANQWLWVGASFSSQARLIEHWRCSLACKSPLLALNGLSARPPDVCFEG